MFISLTPTMPGVGLSGAPVWEPNRGKIVGMFTAVSGPDPFRDFSVVGYVVPIETILNKMEHKKERSATMTGEDIDISSTIRELMSILIKRNTIMQLIIMIRC